MACPLSIAATARNNLILPVSRSILISSATAK